MLFRSAMSLNWYIENLTLETFTKLAFKGWRGKLKTLKYYVHTRPAAMPQKFSIDPTLQQQMIEKLEAEKHKRSTKFMESSTEICDLCSA